MLKGTHVIPFVLVMSLMVGQERSGEHPKEHPSQKEVRVVTKDNLATAIENYVTATSSEGMYRIKDEKTGQTLNLKLVKVHKDRLSALGEDTYFACADFETADGKAYDLDFFMQGKTADDLTFTESTIHKDQGVARYGWIEEEGVWKRVVNKKE